MPVSRSNLLLPFINQILISSQKKAQKPKKPKHEPQDSTAVEVIVLSD